MNAPKIVAAKDKAITDEALQAALVSYATQSWVAAGFAPLVHSHAISDVTGLTSALAGKASAVHSHAGEDITSGTVADARLSSNVVLKNAANTLSQPLTLPPDIWSVISAGYERLLYTGTSAYYKSNLHIFRNASDVAVFQINSAGLATFIGAATFAGNLSCGADLVLGGLRRVTAGGTISYIASPTSGTQHLFANSIGSGFSNGAVVVIGDGGSGVGANVDFLRFQNYLLGTVASVSPAGAATFSGGTTLGGAFNLAPITKSKLLASTPNASTGGRWRVTDAGNREAYPDGTNWKWASDDSIVS